MLLAPTLGTWYGRLFAYAWPLWLLALPEIAGVSLTDAKGRAEAGRGGFPARVGWAVLLGLHLLVCVVGMEVVTRAWLALVVLLAAGAFALFYGQLRPAAVSSSEA